MYDVRAGNEVLLRVEGELDLMAVPHFLDRFAASIPSQADAVLVDVGALSFLDVAGVRALVQARDLTHANGVHVRLRGLSDGRLPVARALHLQQYFEAAEQGQE